MKAYYKEAGLRFRIALLRFVVAAKSGEAGRPICDALDGVGMHR